jgi:ornithine carbamoyltransferase
MADLFTLWERLGELRGRKLAWVGDSNNVALSLALACQRTGMRMSLAAPRGYDFSDASRESLADQAPGLEIEFTRDVHAAVDGADAVYTDVWASMGQESEREQRQRDFAAYQVNEGLMAAAPTEAVFMHCLPARRGEEVTDEVIDSPASVIIEQAANRMHVQKGILVWLLEQARQM